MSIKRDNGFLILIKCNSEAPLLFDDMLEEQLITNLLFENIIKKYKTQRSTITESKIKDTIMATKF